VTSLKWIKKGLIYNVSNLSDWAHSHAHKGVNVSSVVKYGNYFHMYYIGWNPGITVPTRNAIGLAISKDGMAFEQLYEGPILDRNKEEPYYTGAVFVMPPTTTYPQWRMWYTSGTRWEIIDGKPEICYHIKYAESENEIDWRRGNISCIIPSHKYEVVARPWAIQEDGVYKMWYSKRDMRNFRTNPNNQYRAGYAESTDGISWIRLDERVGIMPSENGWDSEAIAYQVVYIFAGKKYLLYNGNDLGRSGFGHAIEGEE